MLLFVGAQWLVTTTRSGDLLLNAVALTYIMDIDEDLFLTVVPRQIAVVIRNLEPLPCRMSPRMSCERVPFDIPVTSIVSLISTTLFVFGMSWVYLGDHALQVERTIETICGNRVQGLRKLREVLSLDLTFEGRLRVFRSPSCQCCCLILAVRASVRHFVRVSQNKASDSGVRCGSRFLSGVPYSGDNLASRVPKFWHRCVALHVARTQHDSTWRQNCPPESVLFPEASVCGGG